VALLNQTNGGIGTLLGQFAAETEDATVLQATFLNLVESPSFRRPIHRRCVQEHRLVGIACSCTGSASRLTLSVPHRH
jgi:hypothetical protein